jgi:hypothetical protein
LIFCLLFYQEKSEGGLGANPKVKRFLWYGDFNMENTHYAKNHKIPIKSRLLGNH